MPATVVLKRNDRQPPIEASLEQAAGTPINLTGASVKFIMRNEATVKVNATATIIDANRGVVKYEWGLTDTDTAGTYQAEFEITFADGRKLTVPNDEYIVVVVLEDLA